MGLCKRIEIEEVSQWVQNIFKRSWLKHYVNDIISDFSNGVTMIHLVEALSCKKLPILFPEPKYLKEKIGNIELALQAFKDDGVQCPGIFAHDIAKRDEEIIIMFCHVLKHYYSREKPLQDWSINAELPSAECPLPDLSKDAQLVTVDNDLDFMPFKKEDISVFDWVSLQIGKEILNYHIFKDGVLLCKLINIVSSRRIPDKVITNASGLERIKLALDFGFHELGIQAELQPKDILLGKNRAALRKYLNELRNFQIQQRQAFESSSRMYLPDAVSFTDSSLERYVFYDLLHISNSKQGKMNSVYKKDGWLVVQSKGMSRSGRRKEDENLQCFTEESRHTELPLEKETSSSSSPALLFADFNESSMQKKPSVLHSQLDNLQNSIHELKLRMGDSKLHESQHSQVEKLGTKNKSYYCRKNPMANQGEMRVLAADGRFMDRHIDSGLQKDRNNKAIQKSNLTLESCQIESKTIDNVGENHDCADENYDYYDVHIDNRDIDRKQPVKRFNNSKLSELNPIKGNDDKDKCDRNDGRLKGHEKANLSTSSLSSVSTLTHEATRFVRMNSRKPKGSADH